MNYTTKTGKPWSSKDFAKAMIDSVLAIALNGKNREGLKQEGYDQATLALEENVDKLLGLSASGKLVPESGAESEEPAFDDASKRKAAKGDSFAARARAEGDGIGSYEHSDAHYDGSVQGQRDRIVERLERQHRRG